MTEYQHGTGVVPFTLVIPAKAIDDLYERLRRTRLPESPSTSSSRATPSVTTSSDSRWTTAEAGGHI